MKSKNLLIIDDDVDDTDFFCAVVAELDPDAKCTVQNKCNNIPALIKSLLPLDFIFLDGQISPVTGMECLREIVKEIDPQRTKVIIHTGGVSPQHAKQLMDAGAQQIILKANSFADLKDNLKKLLL